ncbi:MAG: GNAT family N-acyltransferase [Sphingomonadaceae bacterium]
MILQEVASTALTPQLLTRQPHLHRQGRLEVRIAASEEEIVAAQALRYEIFFEEMGAAAPPVARASSRDIDPHDEICDHLLVIDHGPEEEPFAYPCVVGTYRLLRQLVAERSGGFYSAGEYDLTPLLESSARTGQLLELGRSCVAAAHRNSTTISLLWRGIASYLRAHHIGTLFGCASFHGTDPQVHSAELSLLAQEHLAPPHLRARALDYVPLDILAPGSYDMRAAARALPPLIKGYLRVGATVGDGAFIDRQFNTVDVFVVMPVEAITRRYLDRFTSNPDCN